MENEILIEQFCGVNLFEWKNWDIMDTDNFYYYNVRFLIPSMQQYNGMDVGKWFNGTMEIYGGDNADQIVWSGYVTDIKEVMDELNKRSKP